MDNHRIQVSKVTMPSREQINVLASEQLKLLADVAKRKSKVNFSAFIRDAVRLFVKENLSKSDQRAAVRLYFPEMTDAEIDALLETESTAFPFPGSRDSGDEQETRPAKSSRDKRHAA